MSEQPVAMPETCLKCGYVAHVSGTRPVACPECGAIYAKVRAALERGDAIHRTGAAARTHGQPAPQAAREERPGWPVSIFLTLAFSATVFAVLAALVFFGMLITAPGDGNNKGWSAAFDLIVHSLLVGWGAASLASLVLSLMRRPLAGIFAGLGIGLLAAIVAGFTYG